MKQLRPYQEATVDKVLSSSKDSLVCLPTGSGKTVIAAELIKRIQETVVFIVPRLELLGQASDEFGEVDILWSDKTSLMGRHCIVASKASLRTGFNLLPLEVVLIFDEAHIGIEQTYKLIQQIKPKRVIGLTATPERMDGLALLKGKGAHHKFACFDELLQEETVGSLIDKGYLTKLRYFTRPIEGITKVKAKSAGEELSGEQMEEIFTANQIWGDLVKSYEEYGRNRPAIGFTKTVSMAEKVAELFRGSGYNFRCIHGEMSVPVRKHLIDDLRNKRIDGLVNADLLTYGFDCPEGSYAFSCRHIKSRPLWFQIVGRILRICAGKTDAVFIDHGDSISEFAEPNCALPILDPALVWKANGETKEQKAEHKRQMKQFHDTLEILHELSPLPVDMVEITPDNTWDRMVKALKELREQNLKLSNIVTSLSKENMSLNREKEMLTTTIKSLKKTKSVQKFVDSDATFEFCRKNYAAVRGQAHDELKSSALFWRTTPMERNRLEHNKTVEELKRRSANLKFLLDESTFNSSMNWWHKHYVPYDNDEPEVEQAATKPLVVETAGRTVVVNPTPFV